MNKIQAAKLYMYNAVVSYCDSRPDIINSMGALTTSYTEFKTVVTALVDTVQLKAKIISGYAEGKNDLRNILVEEGASLAGRISSYAKTTKNTVLLGAVNYTALQLKRLRADELAPACLNIVAAAMPYIDELAPYNITKEDLERFANNAREYAAWIPLPRNAISQRATYVKTLRELFRKADSVLRQHLDRQIMNFKKTDADFYNAYRSNRVIIDLANSPSQIRGSVFDMKVQKLVVGATVTILETNETVLTDFYGGFKVCPVPPGVYTAQVNKDGYTSTTVAKIVVKPGKTSRVFAQMTEMVKSVQ